MLVPVSGVVGVHGHGQWENWLELLRLQVTQGRIGSKMGLTRRELLVVRWLALEGLIDSPGKI